jgi:hypothetical protein
MECDKILAALINGNCKRYILMRTERGDSIINSPKKEATIFCTQIEVELPIYLMFLALSFSAIFP